MNWDWKGGIARLFGIGTAKVEKPQIDPAIAAAIAPSKNQLLERTHREYTPAEISDIIEYMRQLKDVSQTNIMVMNNLAAATVPAGQRHALEIYEMHCNLDRQVKLAQTMLDVPNREEIAQKMKAARDVITPLIPKLSRLAIETTGHKFRQGGMRVELV